MTRIVLNEWQTQFGCAGPPDIIRSFTVSDTLEQPDGEYWPHLYVPGSVTCGMTLIYDNGCCTSLEDYPISDSYALSWMQVQASGTQWESASTLSNSFHYCMNDNSVLYLANGACLDQSVRCFPNQTLSLYDQDGCHNLLETHDLHSPVTSVYGAFEIYQPKESKALITYTEMPYKVMHFNTPLEVFSLVCFAISYLLLLYFIYQVIFTMRHARNGFRALQLSSYLIAFMCGIMKLYTHVESFQTDNPQEYLRFALIAAAELSLDKIATLLSAIATLNYILVPLVGSGWSFKRKLVLNLCLIVLHLILCAGSYTVWVENYLSVFEDPRYYQLIGFQNLVYPWDIYWRLFLVFMVDPLILGLWHSHLCSHSITRRSLDSWDSKVVQDTKVTVGAVSGRVYCCLVVFWNQSGWIVHTFAQKRPESVVHVWDLHFVACGAVDGRV